MGKHNGKARKTGKSVGSALVNKARKDGKVGHADSYLYTTDNTRSNAIDSVIQQNALEELMSMAELADRDFTADRGRAVVIKAGGTMSVAAHEVASSEAARRKAEEENSGKLCVPRRPPWTSKMTAWQTNRRRRRTNLPQRLSRSRGRPTRFLTISRFSPHSQMYSSKRCHAGCA